MLNRLKFIQNNATGVAFELPLKDLNECLDNMHILKDIKSMLTNKVFPYIDINIVSFFINFLPNYVFEHIVRDYCKRFDLIITNIPGPVKKLIYDGSEVEDIVPMFSNGLLKRAVPVITYNNTVKFIYSVDECLEQDTSIMIDNIDAIYNELILKYK